MFDARRDEFGTRSVSQLRVSTTVWRQRTARTFPCVPSASWIQSPAWIELSSWSATPPRMLPSVAWSERARTPLTTALVATIDSVVPSRRASQDGERPDDVAAAEDQVRGDDGGVDLERREGEGRRRR